MAFAQAQAQEDRSTSSWPFRKRRSVRSENIDDKSVSKISHEYELQSTRNDPLKSIFLTDSSRTIDFSEIKMYESTTPSININSNSTIATNMHQGSIHTETVECPICSLSISSSELKQMPCCLTQICTSCLVMHTITNINDNKNRIECPCCSQEINSSTILYNSELPISARERYQQILAQDLSTKQNTFIKLCPHCNFITVLDENDPEIRGKQRRRSAQQWINCEQCNKEWCWRCYSPAHPTITCKDFKKDHVQLRAWAKSRRSDNNQRNAQRCPKCSIYIERTTGCDHMTCTRCNSKFCYRCGSRMRLPLVIGHDAKFSIFGCKYKLWPNRPFLRWLVRGSIFTGVILLTPFALAAILALVAIGLPTVLILGIFALPIFLCIQCSKR